MGTPVVPVNTPQAPRIFATPGQVLNGYMLPGEAIWYDEPPSLSALVVDNLLTLLGSVVVAVLAIRWSDRLGGNRPTGIALILIGLALTIFLVRRALDWYTRYVLTDARIMRMSGFVRREMAYIPWSKVTDISVKSTPVGRILGYRTVRIESANEASGLRDMTNLRRPEMFRYFLDLGVRTKQGGALPLPLDSVVIFD